MATDNKYDRQLRLWGKHGQMALADAHIALVGAGATATETMKNLVLPGIGAFTVVRPPSTSHTDPSVSRWKALHV